MLQNILSNNNGGPIILTKCIQLNPRKKIRLHLDTAQQIHRIKNCCGKVNKAYDFQVYFYIQNNCTTNTFCAKQNTSLTDILNNPMLSTYVRLSKPFINKNGETNYDKNNDDAFEDDHIHDDEFRRCGCSSDGDSGNGEWLYMQTRNPK